MNDVQQLDWEEYKHAPVGGSWTHYASFEGGAAFRDTEGHEYVYLDEDLQKDENMPSVK